MPSSLQHIAALATAAALAGWVAACVVAPPKQRHDAVIYSTRDRPPDKPGESLNKSLMCSCKRCEVATCCRELDQDAPEDQGKCESYDFEQCGGIEVSSCEGRCFQHRWRAPVDAGCAETRPEACCNAFE